MSQTKYFVKHEGDARSRFTITGDWPASAMRTIQRECEASGFKEVTGWQYFKFRLSGLSWGGIALRVSLLVLAIAALAWMTENFMAILTKTIAAAIIIVIVALALIKYRLEK